MKKIFALVLLFCFCLAADPVEGCWLSIDEKTGAVTAGWEIYQKDGLLYGQILSAAGKPLDKKAEKCKPGYSGFPVSGNVNEMTVVGTPWIYGLKQNKSGTWSGGNIIDPASGSQYGCKITYHAADGARYKTDTLEMRGEIGLGIGRSQFWQKSDRAAAISLK